jgi:hypothetical protein
LPNLQPVSPPGNNAVNIYTTCGLEKHTFRRKREPQVRRGIKPGFRIKNDENKTHTVSRRLELKKINPAYFPIETKQKLFENTIDEPEHRKALSYRPM